MNKKLLYFLSLLTKENKSLNLNKNTIIGISSIFTIGSIGYIIYKKNKSNIFHQLSIKEIEKKREKQIKKIRNLIKEEIIDTSTRNQIQNTKNLMNDYLNKLYNEYKELNPCLKIDKTFKFDTLLENNMSITLNSMVDTIKKDEEFNFQIDIINKFEKFCKDNKIIPKFFNLNINCYKLSENDFIKYEDKIIKIIESFEFFIKHIEKDNFFYFNIYDDNVKIPISIGNKIKALCDKYNVSYLV